MKHQETSDLHSLVFWYADCLPMKPFAEQFYKSKAWQDCRAAYLESVGGLCECCLAQGRYTPAEIVHHKIELTPENINAPKVTLNWDNLEAVCRECHAMRHGARQRRYKLDELGRATARDLPPR